jgi:hypothetical protein
MESTTTETKKECPVPLLLRTPHLLFVAGFVSGALATVGIRCIWNR